MSRVTWLLAAVAVALIPGGGSAEAGYITLAPPGATFSVATGVSGGNVVGFYGSGGTTYGFLYNGTTYTTIAPPGATSTFVYGVSGGNVVGFYEGSGTDYGFLYQQSVPEPSGLLLATMVGYFGLRRRMPSATARPGTRD